ncbi:MAG: hypothetical protein ACYDBI_05890 [Thermoplasmataceae archaeon]
MTILQCPVCASSTRLYEHANDCYRPFITNYSIYCMNDDCFYGLESSPNELDIIEKHNKLATYAMAGKLMEKFPGIEIGPDGMDTVTYGWNLLSHFNNGLYSWESAVRDAYKTLMKEAE